jgi:hypothetical protein
MSYRRCSLVLLVAALVVTGAAFAAAGKGNVDELRFGAEADAEGVVPPESHGNSFVKDGDIHVSMKVQEAPKGTNLVLSILDRETEEVVWSEEQLTTGGHEGMHFTIASGKLNPGKYRAKVKLGNDWVAEHEFQVQ